MAEVFKLQFQSRTLTHSNWDGYLAYNQTESILDFYPIGTLYKTLNADFDPNVTFGGTWTTVNFEGRTPVGFFDANSTTGGEETHTLSLDECPSHNHSFGRVLYKSYNNDSQTSNWNNYYSSNGSLDKISNGRLSTKENENKGTHNNIQKSMIVKFWERIA